MIISKVFTIANPEKTACNKSKEGNVVCHPGITDAKSIDTIVCTEYKGVAKPASNEKLQNVANL
jgi:hypothetical protein